MSNCGLLEDEERVTPATTGAVLNALAQRRRSIEASRYLVGYLASFSVFEKLESALDNLTQVLPNWNSYGSPAPTSTSVARAKQILWALRTRALEPERVLPSADGGVSFTFVSDTVSRAAIESLNDGEIYVLLYDLRGNSQTIDWPTSDRNAQLDLIERVAAHLRNDGLAAKSN
jgi:hypothetical protein